jgi:hypothetical protein
MAHGSAASSSLAAELLPVERMKVKSLKTA